MPSLSRVRGRVKRAMRKSAESAEQSPVDPSRAIMSESCADVTCAFVLADVDASGCLEIEELSNYVYIVGTIATWAHSRHAWRSCCVSAEFDCVAHAGAEVVARCVYGDSLAVLYEECSPNTQ